MQIVAQKQQLVEKLEQIQKNNAKTRSVFKIDDHNIITEIQGTEKRTALILAQIEAY